MNARETRVEALDYLRGLLAVAVMVYHYASWAGAHLDAGTVLGRLGIYAVSMFYVLSGLSLGLVYGGGAEIGAEMRRYVIQRLFRIAPLFWVVVTLSIILMVLPPVVKGDPVPAIDAWRVFLNYSLLFGFVEPTAYFSTGAWSIGNEVVFYVFFPALVWIRAHGKVLVLLAFFASLWVASVFTGRIDAGVPLSSQWSTYINPLNQLPFFIAGVIIAAFGRMSFASAPWIGVGMLLAGVAMFLVPLVDGGSQALVTLETRPYYLLACVLMVGGVYQANAMLVRVPFAQVMSLLGASTYSIYLLHPFLPVLTTRLFPSAWLAYSVAAILTLVVSYITYRWFELPMMRMGKKFVGKASWRAGVAETQT